MTMMMMMTMMMISELALALPALPGPHDFGLFRDLPRLPVHDAPRGLHSCLLGEAELLLHVFAGPGAAKGDHAHVLAVQAYVVPPRVARGGLDGDAGPAGAGEHALHVLRALLPEELEARHA